MEDVDGVAQSKEDPLSLDVSTQVNCKWRDGHTRKARVIERRRVSWDTSGPEAYEYYVHYMDCMYPALWIFICVQFFMIYPA